MAKSKGSSAQWQTLSSGDFWKPANVGESRVGEITAFRAEKTKFGISAVCDFADVETGEMFSVWSSSADLRKLNRLAVGTKVRLEFQGEQKVPNRRAMKDGYLVQVEAGSKVQALDWFIDAGHSYDRSKQKKTVKRKKSA